MKKNSLVECYRFIVALSILWFHILKIWSNNNNLRFGVEFFYILSGFLLMAHCEKYPEETALKITFKKIKSFYPYIIVSFIVACTTERILHGKAFFEAAYEHLHQLLFLTNILKEIKNVSWLGGTGPLWFVTAQIWATFILAQIIQKHNELYKTFLSVFLMCGYIVLIRCSGNLNTFVYWTIGENKIFVPLLLIRAMSGMACGTVVYLLYLKLNKFVYTEFAKKGGGFFSLLFLLMGLFISSRSKNQSFNSYGWRSMIVVILYMGAILLSFVFGHELKLSEKTEKLFMRCGKWSLLIYVTHPWVIYIMKETMEMPCFRRRYAAVAFMGTFIASAAMNIGVDIVRRGWAAFMVWLKKMCIAEPIE